MKRAQVSLPCLCFIYSFTVMETNELYSWGMKAITAISSVHVSINKFKMTQRGPRKHTFGHVEDANDATKAATALVV